MKVLGRLASINVRKVMWTAAQLELTVEREDWGAGFRSTQEPGYVAMNPNALVPVLIDGDFVLWESNSVCRYLANKHGATTLLPAEPQARAQVEQWMGPVQATAMGRVVPRKAASKAQTGAG